MEKVYTKIQTKSLRIQKIIYIRLQERIEKFKIKYEERSDIIILLNYINESVGVELYRTDKKIEEQQEKETPTKEASEIISKTKVITPIERQKSIKKNKTQDKDTSSVDEKQTLLET